MTREYKKYTETPTIMLLLTFMSISTLLSIITMLFALPPFITVVIRFAVVTIGSIGVSVFLVAILWPASCDAVKFLKRKAKQDEPTDF